MGRFENSFPENSEAKSVSDIKVLLRKKRCFKGRTSLIWQKSRAKICKLFVEWITKTSLPENISIVS